MKKVILAGFVAAIAFAVNAASVVWKTNYEVLQAQGGTGPYTTADYAYLIDATVLTQQEIYNSVLGGMSLANAVSGKNIGGTSMSDGMISSQEYTDGVVSGVNRTLYMVLVDNDLEAIYFSEAMTKVIENVGGTTFSFKSNSSADAVAKDMTGFDAKTGGWYQVPEPTSGLLMMFGVGLMALKRKLA